MPKDVVVPSGSPPPVGPYSPAVSFKGLLFVSGQVPRASGGAILLTGSVAAQTRAMLDAVGALLTASGLSFGDVVKTTVFLTDMNDFSEMNAVYATYFPAPYPARSTVAVSALPLGARMEIDVIAAEGASAS